MPDDSERLDALNDCRQDTKLRIERLLDRMFSCEPKTFAAFDALSKADDEDRPLASALVDHPDVMEDLLRIGVTTLFEAVEVCIAREEGRRAS